ncbi:MAG TPA: hypothetical protein VFU17_09915 [Candidatus Limnocylindrales bacterium]|nr:hypothetical protein [Candidatus Limnocylindrales bacterium]
MNELRTNSGLRRTGAVLIVGALVLGGSIATAAAFNGRGSASGEDPASPAPSAPVVTPAPVTPGPVVTPEPTDAPEPTVVPEPIETPDPSVVPEPTDDSGDVPTVIDLETADGHDVTVDLSEIAHLLDGAESGHPAEGMSVEPYTLNIENLDERTLKLTWVDFGIDNTLALYLFQDGKVLVMVQPEPNTDVDAVGFDRELILTFKEPISAGDLQGFLQGGLDTPGDDAA